MRAQQRLIMVPLVIFVACGGGQKMKLGPLEHHFEERYIASVPVEQKQTVLDAETAYARQKMVWQKAEADVRESLVDVSVAENEVAQRKLEVDSRRERSGAAERGYDTGRTATAADDLAVADKMLEQARAQLAYEKARHAYLVAERDFLRERLYAKEARLELERALIADAHSIRPPTTVDQFLNQYELRRHQATTLRQRSQQKLAESKQLHAAWRELGGGVASQAAAQDTAAPEELVPEELAPEEAAPEEAAPEEAAPEEAAAP